MPSPEGGPYDPNDYDTLPGQLLRVREYQYVDKRKLILSAADGPTSLDDESSPTGLEIYTESAYISKGLQQKGDVRIQATILTVKPPDDKTTLVSFNLSGADRPDTGKAGEVSGEAGKLLSLFAGEIQCPDGVTLSFESRGGKGGDGSGVVAESLGEAGSSGGSGGSIHVVFGDVHSRAIGLAYGLLRSLKMLCTDAEQARTLALYHQDLLEDFAQACEEVCETTGNSALSGWLPILSLLIQGSWNEYPTEKETKVVRAILEILASGGDRAQLAIRRNCRTFGGLGGTGGRGNWGSGAAGARGASGKVQIHHLLGSPQDLCLIDGVIPAHPDQCSMVLELARFNYFVNTDDSLDACYKQLQRLVSRLSFVDHIQDGDPLYKTYQEAESRLNLIPRANMTGGPAAIATLKDVRAQAWTLWQQLRTQVDYFGNQPHYAPRCSYVFYDEMLAQVLKNLEIAERAHRLFYRKARQAEERRSAVQLTKTLAQDSLSAIERHLKKLREDLTKQEETVRVLNSSLPKLRQDLVHVLKGVEDQVQKAIPMPGFGWMDFVEAATMLCFCPNPAMGVVQGVGLLVKGYQGRGIQADDGTLVKSDLLIQEIRAVTKTEDLVESYKAVMGSNSPLEVDDAAAPKLIMEKEKMMEILERFRTGLTANTLDKVAVAFQRYIDVTIERNNAVLQYNVFVNNWQQKLIAHETQTTLKEEASYQTALDPDLPAVSLYMERMYQYNLWATLEIFYMAQQALRFWGLTDEKPIQQALGDNPVSNLHHGVLAPMRTNMLLALTTAVESYAVQPADIPHTRYPIDDFALGILKDTGEVIINIPAVRKGTTTSSHPLAGLCAVRLTKARFFIEGVTTDSGFLRLSITHLGQETIVDQHDVPRDYVHSQVKVPFKYKISAAPNFTKGDPETIDADIGEVTQGKTQSQYALVGPFTSWHIAVTEKLNPGLVLGNASKAYFVFEGKAYDL